MSAFDELQKKQERGEKLTSLEFAVWWCTDEVARKEAASELADYELRLDLLAKGATWEHEENERLKEEIADLRERMTKLESICRMVINGEHCDNDGRGCGASAHVSFELGICPVCTWRGDVTLRDGVCPYCNTDWNFLRGNQ